jgi:hypothetical protein
MVGIQFGMAYEYRMPAYYDTVWPYFIIVLPYRTIKYGHPNYAAPYIVYVWCPIT